MSKLQIISNYHERPVVYFWELSEEERAEFDWRGVEEETYVRYKGEVYCLSEFMRTAGNPDAAFRKWHGYHSDSFFSGILVRYPDDGMGDFVVMGWYMS